MNIMSRKSHLNDEISPVMVKNMWVSFLAPCIVNHTQKDYSTLRKGEGKNLFDALHQYNIELKNDSNIQQLKNVDHNYYLFH